ncbi:unnamed protein product, partial [marine sediment metagenome]
MPLVDGLTFPDVEEAPDRVAELDAAGSLVLPDRLVDVEGAPARVAELDAAGSRVLPDRLVVTRDRELRDVELLARLADDDELITAEAWPPPLPVLNDLVALAGAFLAPGALKGIALTFFSATTSPLKSATASSLDTSLSVTPSLSLPSHATHCLRSDCRWKMAQSFTPKGE